MGDVGRIVAELREDGAVMSADTVPATIPNQLDTDFNRPTFDALVEIRNQLASGHTAYALQPLGPRHRGTPMVDPLCAARFLHKPFPTNTLANFPSL